MVLWSTRKKSALGSDRSWFGLKPNSSFTRLHNIRQFLNLSEPEFPYLKNRYKFLTYRQ